MIIDPLDISPAEQWPWPDTRTCSCLLGWGWGRNKHFLPRQIGSAGHEEKTGQPRPQAPQHSLLKQPQKLPSPHLSMSRKGMVLQPPWRAPCTQILLSLIWWPVTGTLASQAGDYSGGEGWEAWEASHAKVCPPRCRDLCTHHQLTWATSCAALGGGEMRPGSQ